ncbi:MAG: 4Fe-4S dicluster domain-containing protein [Rectinemataceae bacterium]|jgi:formate hydrogenlyase subunit 6/NADH:ubiquinone oxidoreductase subunit I
MAHRTLKTSYEQLSDRLNRFPQGAPPSELLFSILRILFSEKEAELVSLLPIKPFDAETAARAWKTEEKDAKKVLDELASRAILVDVERDGRSIYCLPPPMAGFFEFSMMRIRPDLDQKALAELFYQYMNVEEDFIKSLFTEGETQLGRAFVQEPMLSADKALQVLDYERASEVVKTASHIGVGLCYCRHKMQHMGRECDAPMDICMTFNGSAESLTKHGHARAVTASECMGLLETAYERGLVQFGENIQRSVNFICNCCGCCCEALIAQRRFASLNPIHTTNFMPQVDAASCNGCGKCMAACPIEAMSLVSANEPRNPARRKAKVDESICLGCGVCVRACPKGSLKLRSRPSRVVTPVSSAHRAVLMAIERGKLQNLIFDNHALASHRAMAAVVGAILKLPPAKRLMASEQMRSKYLVALLDRMGV